MDGVLAGLIKIRDLFLQVGYEVEFEYNIETHEVTNLVGKAREKIEPKNEPVNSTQTDNSNKWEDDIVNFETLLTVAHNKGKPFSIKTKMLDIDLEKKYALFKATVTVDLRDVEKPRFEKYEVKFEGHGDVTADNVTPFVAKHWIRVAETRSIVRALRWYTNNACAEEEK